MKGEYSRERGKEEGVGREEGKGGEEEEEGKRRKGEKTYSVFSMAA